MILSIIALSIAIRIRTPVRTQTSTKTPIRILDSFNVVVPSDPQEAKIAASLSMEESRSERELHSQVPPKPSVVSVEPSNGSLLSEFSVE